MSKDIQTLDGFLGHLEPRFEQQNQFALKFQTECHFAKQQILKNDFTMQTARNNQASLGSAILNVAAIGISLNPALAHAYLVPRDGSVCLDISYRGLVKLATDSGAIEWAKPELVYEGDTFNYRGPCTPPEHVTDPFSNEHTYDNIRGAYCLAKLSTGDYMVEVMSKDDIEQVRSSSKAANGPWKNWPKEMAKKTIVKRASKSWPQSNGRERMDRAIEVLNQHEGIETEEDFSPVDYLKHSPDQLAKFGELLKQGNPLEFAAWYKSLDPNIQISLNGSFTKDKMANKQLVGKLEKEGIASLLAIAESVKEAIEAGDDYRVREELDDLSELAIEYIRNRLNPEELDFIEHLEQAA